MQESNRRNQLPLIGQILATVFIIELYLIAFIYNYTTIISPIYDVYGLWSQDIPDLAWLFVFFAPLLPLTFLPLKLTRPSDYAIWVLYVFGIIPLPYISYMITDSGWLSPIFFTLSSIGALWLTTQVRKIKLFQVKTFKFSNWALPLLLPLSAIFSISLLIIVYKIYPIGLTGNPYERRFLARELLPSGAIQSYIMQLVSQAIIPLCLIIGTSLRRLGLIGVGALGSLYAFSVTGTKTTLAILILAPILTAVSKSERFCKLYVQIIPIFFLVVAATAIDLYNGGFEATDTTSRRLVAVPAQLAFVHYEYFSKNPVTLLSNSKFNIGMNSRYSQSTPFIIGEEVLGREGASANAGVWANGFADFGYAGFIIVAICVGFVLWFVDCLGKSVNFSLATLISFLLGVIWNEASFQNSLLSHGVLLLLICLLLSPKDFTNRKAVVKEPTPTPLLGST